MVFPYRKSRRQVIVHYHIFKNAGTSIDAILETAFRARWETTDPDPSFMLPSEALARFIIARPKLLAVSSHTICPPLPLIEGIDLHPIFFLREPIARVASVYKFLHARGDPGPSLLSFREFVKYHLTGDYGAVIRNYQTIYLSGAPLTNADPMKALATETDFLRAERLLEDVPAFGIVERFAESLMLFSRALRPDFPQIKWRHARENVSRLLGPTRADEVHTELGPILYEHLCAENSYDIRLYKKSCALFEAALSATTS